MLGLAEQYRRTGLNVAGQRVIREQVERNPAGNAIYLFTARNRVKLAGNLEKWPDEVLTGTAGSTSSSGSFEPGANRLIRGACFIVHGELPLWSADIQELMTVKSPD